VWKGGFKKIGQGGLWIDGRKVESRHQRQMSSIVNGHDTVAHISYTLALFVKKGQN